MRFLRVIPAVAFSSSVLLLAVWLTVATAALTGCGRRGNELAPIGGQVAYRGKPLAFGSVMFLPKSGPPAPGIIQPDGTFKMTTRGLGEGASVGKNRVRVVCFESQDPSSSMFGSEILGRPLIPKKYSSWEISGIEINVRSGVNEPVVLDLVD